ncbi:GNAT family N-acetyltransferase [Aestuariibacter sp. GS-14]|uniref:GNAT family N-acetyltransferase n=1 Tax=Alteromonadaceae TaxID=72275 RepID=UPI001126CEED|nr:GNAT family N-acetyltransferase [Aestuariibacter sp. GS-14]TPV60964.1 GNAT family N-acetyltransferase [Aestuariibacter sp. GS-14]
MIYNIEAVRWDSARHHLEALRRAVFVLEWRLPESAEFDELDLTAFHVLVLDEHNKPIATGRLTQFGELGRIAVLPGYRNITVYKTLFSALLKLASVNNIQQVKVQSALERVDYHRERGFHPEGPVFMEAGLPMQKMVCQLSHFDLPDVEHIH